MEDFNHKTVFVLDHTQYFGISGENTIQLEFVNSKGVETILPVEKSLWTTSVETAAEYCRIVWDLFPTGKLIRFIVSDAYAHIVNDWSPASQNLTHVMNAMAVVSVPSSVNPSIEYTVIHGLRAAVEALAEPTIQQRQKLAANSGKVTNRARVICITSARDDPSMERLEEIFDSLVTEQNLMPNAGTDNILKIDEVHLVVMHLHPSNLKSMVTSCPLRRLSSVVKIEVHSVKARDFANKMTHLTLPHYDLASTTVTDIPMKKEQRPIFSASYDVEIFHSRDSHSVLRENKQELPTSIKKEVNYETVTLKWCTSREADVDLQQCLAQHRITPVDVTSKASSCLINFLLDKRSVLLEMRRKTGEKVTSHMLSSHAGEIFIHTLHLCRSCLDDLPSALESNSLNVADYRINDFASIIRNFKLTPVILQTDREPDQNLERLRAKFAKSTRYFPLTTGSTIVYNVRQFMEPLMTLIAKEDLTDDDLVMCERVIYNLVSFEVGRVPLPLPNGQQRRNDDHYKHLWSELLFILKIGPQSPNHRTLLSFVKREISTDAHKIKRSISQITNSPMSPPRSSVEEVQELLSSSSNRSLLDIQIAADIAISRKRIEFAGRLCTPHGKIAKLYQMCE